MYKTGNTIGHDHQDHFAETFESINELISSDKLEDAALVLSTLHYGDLADFLDNTNHRIYKKILPFLTTIRPETLVFLSNSSAQPVIEALGIVESAKLIDQLDIEDAIEVIENIDDSTKQIILSHLKPTRKYQILEGFTYPENTVGRIIERNFIAFQETWTVKQAIELISADPVGHNLYAAIVTDSKSRPVGSILISTLLKYQATKILKEVMNKELKIADTQTALSELVFVFKQYALTIVPVVSKNGKLIGSVSIDNMIYIIEQQTEKDILPLGGVNAQDTFFNLFKTARHRFPWLFINLITACITSMIINQFSGTISKLITIAAIMPVVASMGGNAGMQAMTVTVRALANKDINYSNIPKVVLKEIIVCGFNGLVLAVIASFALIFTMDLSIHLSIIFAIAILINFLIAGLSGSVIPIMLHSLHIDPATGSGVFLTALTDSFGFFTFLILAYIFLV
jgi:magnesium transporter